MFFILLSCSTLVILCLGISLYLTNNELLSANAEVSAFSENIYPDEILRIENSRILNDYEEWNAKMPRVLVADAEGYHLEVPKVNSSNGTEGDGLIMKASDVEGVEVAPVIQHGLPDGEDKDPIARERRNKVKEVS